MNRHSISFRLIAGCTLCILVPLMVIGIVSNLKSTDALQILTGESFEASAEDMALAIDRILDDQVMVATIISKESELIKLASSYSNAMESQKSHLVEELDAEMNNALTSIGSDYIGTFITDSSGLIYSGALSNGQSYKGINVGNKAYFMNSKNSGKVTVGEIQLSAATGDRIIVICAPLQSLDGQFIGVLGLSMKTKSIMDFVRAKKVGKAGYAFIVDKTGLVLAHANPKHELSLNMNSLVEMDSLVKPMLRGEAGYQLYSFEGNDKIAGYAPIAYHGWSVAVSQEAVEYLASAHSIRNFTALITVLSLLFVVILIFFLAKTIVRPIQNAVVSLKDIAQGEGDLTMRLEVKGKDEVAELSTWFNTFIEKLQKIIGDISENSGFVNDNAGKLNNVSEELVGLTDDSAQRTSMVASASEEMSANLNNVAAAMEQSATNVNMVAAASEEMSATINEIAENAEKARSVSAGAVDQAGHASVKMDELGGAAEKIGKVTETINEISEQTNLLALNATIEAARAGEAGKGFAVVANEIKELAKQTADATQDIKTLIDDVQSTTRSAGNEISEISRIIGGVNDIVSTIATAVEEQTATTSEITQNISQASQGMQEVNESVSQSSAVSGEITRDISEIAIAGQSVSSNTGEIKLAAQELQSTAQNLSDIVGNFKI